VSGPGYAVQLARAPRDAKSALMTRISRELARLGYVVAGRSDEELLVLAARSLHVQATEQEQRAHTRAEETYRARYRALPSGNDDVWGINRPVRIMRLTSTTPYQMQGGTGFITARQGEGEETTRITVSNDRGHEVGVFTRKGGRNAAWGSTASAVYVVNDAARDRPKPLPTPKLQVYWYRPVTSARGNAQEAVIAATSLKDIHTMLRRAGANKFPRVQVTDKPEAQFALLTPFTLFTRPERHTAGEEYALSEDAPRFKAWIELRRSLGG